MPIAYILYCAKTKLWLSQFQPLCKPLYWSLQSQLSMKPGAQRLGHANTFDHAAWVINSNVDKQKRLLAENTVCFG
jgi:hypothetical protein